MKNNCIKLIKIMLEQDKWLTANLLACKLGVSERSVKSYIIEINSLDPELITASRRGYFIDADKAKIFLNNNRAASPQSSKERVNYIITRMLTDDVAGGKKTDLYQLSEELYVSYETIKKDMPKVKSKMLEFELLIHSTNSYVTIEGNEIDKRKILSNILYEEFNANVMSLDIIGNAFPGYDLGLLQTIIVEQCKQYHYFINEYALLSLVLDIVIGLDRIKKERTFGNLSNEGKSYGIREQELARNIATEIEKNFHIVYTPPELEELTVILLSHLMKMDFTNLNSENIESVVGEDCIKIVKEIRHLLKSMYFLDTNNQDFIVKFTLHIKNLLIRLKNGYTTKNPLLDHIKNTCPLIYECAVGVAEKLREITKKEIKEDEIAYIALHIGGNLENQKSRNKLLNCIILFPQYYDFSNKMIEKVKQCFGDKIEIKTVITTIDEIKEEGKADLIISTIPLTGMVGVEWAFVSPFLKDRDINHIDEKIQKITLRKKRASLKRNLMQISNPDFFYKNIDFFSREELIRNMTNILEDRGYVNNSYYDEVFDREKQASTSFEHIAVPHSMKMNANRTAMFIWMNEKKPIMWDNQLVSIVLLFAINQEDRAIFHDVFDNLIVLLLDQANASKVIRCNTYIETIEAVVNCFK